MSNSSDTHQPGSLPRRTVLAQGLATAGLLAGPALPVHAKLLPEVPNVTRLYTVEVARIVAPTTAAEVSSAVTDWPGQVAVGGGRYSMGGQVAVRGGLHLDMRGMNRLVWLRASERAVRVQAGMSWRDLQDQLDPLGLAVKTMQSYSNFTVGGSVSVNCHGRYVGHGPVGNSVRALQIVTASGEVLELSRSLRPELFSAAIGGYGAVGVITELELDVVDNVRIRRAVQPVALADYVAHFKRAVLADPSAVLHNADLAPPQFDAPVCVTWHRADNDTPLTEPARLVARGQRYALEQNVIWLMTELPGGGLIRKAVNHPLLHNKPAVKWLNHEASLDAAELEPRTRAMSSYVLQEYFIPEQNFLAFANGMAAVLQRHDVEALNISIRHSPADRLSALPWAPTDVFSFVLYYKQRTWKHARDKVGVWARELIELALRHQGRYYLPYQLHARADQFERAYPEAQALRRIKREIDPGNKLSNELWRAYL
jgi:FAD/FMN-containing dehydrogenase